MTVPQDVSYASEQFREWLLELKQRALLGSTNQGYAMLLAMLQELRDRSSIDDALRFADALPPLVRGIMLDHWHPAGAGTPTTRRLFLGAVKERLEPHQPPPDSIVDDVLAVLAHRTHSVVLPVLTEHLPPELQAQWRAAVASRPP
jgi:uncharacterized protein (DUF2267 family)